MFTFLTKLYEMRTHFFGYVIGLLVGNFLALSEILYVRSNYWYFHTLSENHLLSSIFAGMLIYGIIISFLLGSTSLLVGLTIVRKPANKSPVNNFALVTGILISTFGFFLATKFLYYDFPGIFELYRYPFLIVGAILLLSIYYIGLTRISFLRNLGATIVSKTNSRFLIIPLLVTNLFFLPFALFFSSYELDNIGTPTGDHDKPPIVWISVSSLRPDFLSIYNKDVSYATPASSKLARDGVLYREVTTTSPSDPRSTYSMFTSKFPPVNGLSALNDTRSQKTPVSIASLLSQHDYRTIGITSRYSSASPLLSRGFDHFTGRKDWGIHNLKLLRYATQLFQIDPPTRSLTRWIQSTESSQVFLFAHYIYPLIPYHPPYPYSLLDSDYVGKASGDGSALTAIRDGRAFQSDEDLEHVESLYSGEVAYTERRIQSLLNALENAGLYEESLIILTAPHGETMTEHNQSVWFANVNSYQETLRVPLVIKYPENEPGGVQLEGPSTTLDLAPTVLREADIQIPSSMKGVPLQPESFESKNSVISVTNHVATIRKNSWKLIYRFRRENRQYELYNLREDPLEQNNRAEEREELVSELRSILTSSVNLD